MKKLQLGLFLVCLLVFPLSAFADTETPASQDYTHIRLRWTGYNVFSSRSTLGNAGYSQKKSLVVSGMESGILYEVAGAGDYGGLLLVEGHGVIDGSGNYYLVGEVFPNTTAGLSAAIDRANFLMAGASYSAGDIQVAYCSEINGYGVCLTEQGLNATFSGSNGLVILASCYGSAAYGNFGSTRLTISWSGVIDGSVAQGEVNTLFSNLTGANGTAYMSTVTAINGTMGYSGKHMALVPYIATVAKPAFALIDTLNTVTWKFGAKMDRSGFPYVGGVAVCRKWFWSDDYTLVCKFYCGWAIDDVIVGLDADLLQSNKGINLLADDVHYFWCTMDSYPPAASVASFTPYLVSSGVNIPVELSMWRGTEALWVVDDQGQLVGDTIRVSELAAGCFEVSDPAGDSASRYTLFEREADGDIFVRASEGVFPAKPEVIPYPEISFDPAALEQELEAWVIAGGNSQTGSLGMIIVPDAWTASAQALASWHTLRGRPVQVVSLSSCGSTREEIRTYIEGFYAQGGRYVLLGAGAADEWYNDITKWPDQPGEDDWRWWYHYYHDVISMVAPGENLIPTFYYEDSEYDNMSYWTPYYTSDYGYVEGLAGLRLGRFPAYSLLEFQVLASKTLTYLDHSASLPYADKVSLWVYAKNLDGNSGLTAEVLAEEISGLIPLSHQQFKLYNRSWAYLEAEGYALADWSAGRGYVIMSGTSSTGHKMIQTWSKSAGWTIGKITGNGYFPFVWGTSCGIGSFDMYVSPASGTIVTRDLLTADPIRGTPLLIAPTRGTWIEGNQQLTRWLVHYAFVEPAMDAGTLFLLARGQVLSGSQAGLARSYNFFGDPMAPLPGHSVTTDAGDSTPRFRNVLGQNYPNPFNPVTNIEYGLEKRGHVSLKIYNVAGQLISTLVDEAKEPGFHRAVWDGRSRQGRAVASGVYFYLLQTGSFSESRKMILLK